MVRSRSTSALGENSDKPSTSSTCESNKKMEKNSDGFTKNFKEMGERTECKDWIQNGSKWHSGNRDMVCGMSSIRRFRRKKNQAL